MKIRSKGAKALIMATLVMTSSMMLGACGSADAESFAHIGGQDGSGPDIVADTPSSEQTYEDETIDYSEYDYYDPSDDCESEEEAVGDYEYEEAYDYEYEDDDDYDYSYEYEGADDGSYDGYEDQGTEESVSGGAFPFGIAEEDYAGEASVLTNDFELTPQPEKVGSTDAEVCARVTNRSGKTVTAVGCTLYYGHEGAIKSVFCEIDDTTSDFDVAFDMTKDLGEILNRDGYYKYKIFVEADGQLYTHDFTEFFTNKVNDNIVIQKYASSVTTDAASITVNVSNPTGASIEAIGCRFSDGLFYLGEQKETGSFTDTQISKVFTLYPEDGKFKSGGTYDYEVFVVCGGQEYTIGVDDFKAPLY